MSGQNPNANHRRPWPRRALTLWRRSLQVRVVASTVSLTVLVTCGLTWFLLTNVKEGLLDQRVNRVVAESVAEVEDAVNRLEASPGIGSEVDAQQRAVVDPIRERGAARGFAVALTLPYEEGQPLSYGGIVKTDHLDMRSIPEDLRRAFANDHRTAHEFTEVVSTGAEIAGVPEGPGVVVAQQLKLPADGKTYTLYFVFSLDQQSETLALVTRSVLTGGIFLALLVGAVTFVVARQVVAPVRQTREVAERLASGHLQERLQVRGEDDLARLASSFNHMASNLQRQILQLEELSRMQRRFVSDVSHELRTPLTTVRMAGDMLHDARDDMDPVTARAAELLHTEIERFELLLADLLEISRFDAGAAVLDLDDVDLVQVAHHVVEVTKPLADSRNVSVLVEAPDGPGIAEADVRRVQRIVRNLVTNAIDHAEGRDIVVRIGHDANSTALTVRDHGVGLGPGESAMVFNRFWRADPARARTSGGTGLGLSISLEDARLHGGWLQAWGRRGEGAQFRLTLPRHSGQLLRHSPLPLVPVEEDSSA